MMKKFIDFSSKCEPNCLNACECESSSSELNRFQSFSSVGYRSVNSGLYSSRISLNTDSRPKRPSYMKKFPTRMAMAPGMKTVSDRVDFLEPLSFNKLQCWIY